MGNPLRPVEVDVSDARVASGVLLATAALLPLIPGHPGMHCPLRALTGIPCPLCGMTTSVEAIVRLHPLAALQANPAGPVAVLAALVLLAFRPARIRLPALTVPLALLGMWLFELHRFSLI